MNQLINQSIDVAVTHYHSCERSLFDDADRLATVSTSSHQLLEMPGELKVVIYDGGWVWITRNKYVFPETEQHDSVV